MYVLQSLTYLYSGLTGKQMPAEFVNVCCDLEQSGVNVQKNRQTSKGTARTTTNEQDQQEGS